MGPGPPTYRKATPVERLFNRAFGALVGLGLGLPHNLPGPGEGAQERQALLHTR